MGWTKVLTTEELPLGERKVIKVGDQKILLINDNGKLHAVNNACPHLKLPLKKGKLTEDGAIVCPFHRSAFDLCTGEVTNWTPWPPVVGNVLGKISPEQKLSDFATRIEDGSILVEV
ncbi:MAG: Rieske (2Fe-2S) protein [Xenococcus sp. (in: cyanobacteria)]